MYPLSFSFFSFQQGAMDTDDLQSEISRLSFLLQEEERKQKQYKVYITVSWLLFVGVGL